MRAFVSRLLVHLLCCPLCPPCYASKRQTAPLIFIFLALTIFAAFLPRYYYQHPLQFQLRKTVFTEDEVENSFVIDANLSLSFYDVTTPVVRTSDVECIRTITSPSVTVCLFDIWHDVYISRSLHSAGIWEPHVVDEFIEAVQRGGPSAGILDIGANVGYYTLIAAQLGHRVVAVEPFLDSIDRLHRGAQMDHTAEKILVVNNAIAELRTKATLRPSGDNQGDARIELRVQECMGTCPVIIDTILLDDLAVILPFRQAVMKIDIQGYEHRAFLRASILFDAVHITHVFMEWELQREFYVSANHTSRDKQLVDRLVWFLHRRRYRPRRLVYYGGSALDPNNWQNWPEDVVWHKLPTDAELLQLSSSHYRQWPPP